MDPLQTDRICEDVRCLKLLPAPSGLLQSNLLHVPEPIPSTVNLTFPLQPQPYFELRAETKIFLNRGRLMWLILLTTPVKFFNEKNCPQPRVL